jgi:O-antigen/teichoic acid export membrane protein
MVGYNTLTAETISSILSTWSPKICAVIAAISVALTTNIIPHVTSYFVCKDYKNVMEKVNQAISTVLIITIPMATLLFLLSNEAYFIFYGNSEYGPLILKTTAIIHVFFSVNAVLTSSLQAMKKFKTIYLNTFIGLLTNACMDIPMILLLNKLGLPAYIGTSLATIIGYTVSISMSLIYLKKNLNFNYKNVLKTLIKTILPFVCLLVPVLLSKIFIKYEYNYLTSFISLIIHGLLGMCLYLFVIYKNGNLSDVFGREYVNRLLKKFHLIKEKHE